jgi:TonB family protein
VLYFGSRSARLGLGLGALLGWLVGLPALVAQAEPEAPKPLARANPDYPRSALRNGIEGSVLIEFDVDEHGRVVAPHVLDAAPQGVFDHAALTAVSRWRYEALGSGTPNVKVRLTFRRGDRRAYARARENPRTETAAGSADWVLPVSGPGYPISADVFPSR